MRVLICGAGFAGLTLAACLRQQGHEVLVVDARRRLRDVDYRIDLIGSGYEVVRRLDLVDELHRVREPLETLRFRRNRKGGFSISYPELRRTLFDGRHASCMRGDLERLLYARVADGAALRFGTAATSIAQNASCVRVTLSDGTTVRVDLVVGADGAHSQIRRLAFGPEESYRRYLGYHAAAFLVEDHVVARQAHRAIATLSEPGRYVGLYSLGSGRAAAFFVHRSRHATIDGTPASARRELRSVYSDLDWVVPDLLDHLHRVEAPYLDTVDQIEMPSWSNRRVVLIGDAAHSASVLEGEGASLAITGAYVLAQELSRSSSLAGSLQNYENRMRPSVRRRQRAARHLARWFVPDNGWSLELRNHALRRSLLPAAAWWARRRLRLADPLDDSPTPLRSSPRIV